MLPWLLIVLGVAVLFLGSRLALFGAALGAMLGLALLRMLPGDQGFWLSLLITGGMAGLFAFGVQLGQGLIDRLVMLFGILAGAAITINLLDLFQSSFGLLDLALVLVGSGIGALLVIGFKRWTLIILAGLLGAMLTMRGLSILAPEFGGLIATSLALLLAATGIAYQGGLFKRG